MKMSVSSLDMMGLIKLHRSDLSLEPLHFSMKKLGSKGWVWDIWILTFRGGTEINLGIKKSFLGAIRTPRINQSVNQSINFQFTIYHFHD